MVIVISECNDITTDRVIEWLVHFGLTDIIRINDGNPVFIEGIVLKSNTEPEISLSYNNKTFTVSQVKCFWYRRGAINFRVSPPNCTKEEHFNNQLYKFALFEWKKCKDYVISKLEEKPHIGDYFRTNTNKLTNLELAASCGLSIPKTFVSQSRGSLLSFASQQKECITKPISEGFFYSGEKFNASTLTTPVEFKYFKGGVDFHFPQLIQNKIVKWIELSVLIICDLMYSMAIFSQNNEKTQIDYRNYDSNKETKCVPFQLPQSVQAKLKVFMQKANLTTGSIDLILTKEREYVFLEVNPIGVIDMLSTTCNYEIEKEIAQRISRMAYETPI